MNTILENSLYLSDRKRFLELQDSIIGFNAVNNGSNIIQDDIFLIMENYCGKHGSPLELIRLPISDNELCACTFLRGGRLFVLLNSKLPLSKQIFAAAHELYHIWCYFEDLEQTLVQRGSILKSVTIDDETSAREDREANAFAGLLLVPKECLNEQIRIYSIPEVNLHLSDVLILMDIFAVPYKAMVLRLFEDGYLNECKTREFLEITDDEIHRQSHLTGKGKRWQIIPNDVVQLGSLEETLMYNESANSLTESRAEADKHRIEEIKKIYKENS